jgi:hypothetical protein
MPIKPQTVAQRAAKQQVVAALVADQPLPPVPLHRTTVVQLQDRFHADPATALAEGRHGHPAKLRGAALALLEMLCRADHGIASWRVQQALADQCQVQVSVSQINRVRARRGLASRPVPPPKKDS